MYRVILPHRLFERNVLFASIRNRAELSTQPCTFCKHRHRSTTKRMYAAFTRHYASVASLGDKKSNENLSKLYSANRNNLLEELIDTDIGCVEESGELLPNSCDRTLLREDEVYDMSEELLRLEESEMVSSVTFTKLQKEVPLTLVKHNEGTKTDLRYPLFLSKMDYKFNRTSWYCCLVDAYVKTGNSHLAKKLFELARLYKIVKMSDKTQSIYNLMIDSAVRESKHQAAMQIYKFMLQDRITPNAQTYISLLLMVKEMEQSKRKGFLLKIEGQMEKMNLRFNDLFDMGKFRYDDRSVVLSTVRLLYPEFTPIYSMQEIPKRPEGDIAFVKDTKTSYKEYIEDRMTFRDMQLAFKEQIRNEWEGFVEVDNISLSKEDEAFHEIQNQKHLELEKRWREKLSVGFDRHLSELIQMEKAKNSLEQLHPYLILMDKDIYVDCMMKQVMQICKFHHSFARPLNFLAQELGYRIYRKYEIQTMMEMGVLDKIIDIHYRYLQWYGGLRHLGNINSRNAWKRIQFDAHKDGASSTVTLFKWPPELAISIGKFLFNVIIEEVTLPSPPKNTRFPFNSDIPVFSTQYTHINRLLVKQVHCNSQIAKIFKERGISKLLFETYEVPTICPPRPWIAPLEGGYYISHKCVLRRSLITNILQTSLLDAQPAINLLPLYDSLNMLGAVPWKINEPILDLVIKIFKQGGSEELQVPEPGSSVKDLPPLVSKSTLEDRQYNKKQYAQKLKQQATHALWCDALHRLSIANHYRGKSFWMPHNIDFRGRAYPIPPHLSHMSSDLSRSLLLFGQGKPLGPDGFDWLKIHAINLSGRKKKYSLEDKLNYANKVIDNIVDSAERPLDGKRWWVKSDHPWQTLAACMEIANVLKHSNPEEYVCHLPIHQDGSCNGLQHYAALGRDQFGAFSVNLSRSDTPQDVYSVVVEQVEKMRKLDAEQGVQPAKLLEGFVSRKLIKQTIMTTVYGVTFFGAKLQINKQLRTLDSFPQEAVLVCSKYLAEKTFQSLNTMFTSAKEIQDWLTKCARLITHDCQRPVEWITPLGLHVLQPYIKNESTERGANMKSMLDKLKQKNAFAPNFIHSLDSVHMMLTALRCDEENVTFVSVHDCFWTHPSTVTKMNKICREQFVKLHKEPIIENVYKFFKDYYNNGRSPCAEYSRQFDVMNKAQFPPPPEKGQFNIEEVLNSPYFFS